MIKIKLIESHQYASNDLKVKNNSVLYVNDVRHQTHTNIIKVTLSHIDRPKVYFSLYVLLFNHFL